MVRALGHSSLVVIMALTLLPSMPILPIYAVSPQSVQYSHLWGKKEVKKERNGVNCSDFFTITNLLSQRTSVCLCVSVPMFRVNSHSSRSADKISGISISELP